MNTKLVYAAVMAAFCLSAPFSNANESVNNYKNKDKRGWHFYEDPEIVEEEEKKPTPKVEAIKPEMVEINVGNEIIDAKNRPDIKVEAGTGYFKTSWTGEEIKPEMATVSLTKKDKGVSWGGLYWQYFEQLDKITPAKTPLSLEKKLFVVRNTDKGEIIEPITKGDKLKVGDKVRVRVVLRSDRDMEYVHLKDMRASGFEPINVFSGYRYQDGLGYYETTKDASTNFFISWLAKGTYVFEYDLRANIAGNFSNGITSIQCMYAPEFASHSEGIRVEIKE